MVATIRRIPGERVLRNGPPTAREAIARVFENLGGVDGLTAWAKGEEPEKAGDKNGAGDKSGDNKKIFYTQIWPKIIGAESKDVGADHDPIEVIRQIIVDR